MRFLLPLLFLSAVIAQTLVRVDGPGPNVTGSYFISRVNVDTSLTYVTSGSISAGTFTSVLLPSNTGLFVGTTYRVHYNNVSNVTTVTETWTIPASPTTTTRAAIFSGAPSSGIVTSIQGLSGDLIFNVPSIDNTKLFLQWGTGGNALRLTYPMASGNASATAGAISGAEYVTLAAKAQTGSACAAGFHISQIFANAAPTCTADTGGGGVTSLQGSTGALTFTAPTIDNTINLPTWGSGGNNLRLAFPLASANASATAASLTGAEYITLNAKAQTGAACSAGQAITQVSSSSAPTCTAIAGTTTFTGLTDCKVTRASNVYSIAPCKWAISGTSYSNVSAATATLTGASGASTLYIYLDTTGINVAHTTGASIACVGCNVVTSISAFPTTPETISLATAAYTLPSTFADPTDFREIFRTLKVVPADTNLVVTNTGGETRVGVATAINFAAKSTTPNQTGVAATRTAIATCAQGQTFLQTDGSSGLYTHLAAAGACSWAAPVTGGTQKLRATILPVTERVPGVTLDIGPGINVLTAPTGYSLSYVANQPVLLYADSVSADPIEFDISLSDWASGTINLTVETITSGGLVSTGQYARFIVATVCLADGDNADSPTYNANQTFDVTHGTVNGSFAFFTKGTLALTTTGCTSAKTMRIKFSSDRASDTHAGNIGVRRFDIKE